MMDLPEVRILLLGNRASGKSSVANAILGRAESNPRTALSVWRQGDVAGRRLTVVEGPGWWSNYLLRDTPKLNKQQVLLSPSLCPPGPHAVLLVIRVDTSFTERNRRAAEEHLQLLGEDIWRHTLVLFSCGDRLADPSITRCVETCGTALRWLVERCGNRCHVLNHQTTRCNAQVTALLEKIEHMVAWNNGSHFEMSTEMLRRVEERRMKVLLGAEKRVMQVMKQREALQLLTGSQSISELRIVLLGHRYVGKSSTGNTIFGRKEFDGRRTARCVSRQGDIAGKKIAVVEAPCWWNNFLLRDTPELTKLELKLCQSACSPGPHVFLLLVRLDGSFIDVNRRAAEEHLGLLGERVWNHTMVLFTYGDWLGDTRVEQHIESEGNGLQWLIDKCHNRYHVFRNDNNGDGTQVAKLLEKMDEMVAGNRYSHYEVDKDSLQTALMRRWAAKEGAHRLLMKVQDKRETLRLLMCDGHHLSEPRVVVLGCRSAGKSSSVSTILGRADSSGWAAGATMWGEAAGRRITIVEAPGWVRNHTAGLTAEEDKWGIVQSVSLCRPGPHCLLLVIQADASFTEKHRQAVKEHMELLGESAWNHTIVLFTCGDWLGDNTIEEHIEMEGQALQWVVEACRNRYHVLNNKSNQNGAQVTELLEKIEELVGGNHGRYFEMSRSLSQSVAGMLEHDEEGKNNEPGEEQEAESAAGDVSMNYTRSASKRTRKKLKLLDHTFYKARSIDIPPHVAREDKDDASSDYGSQSSLHGVSFSFALPRSIASSLSSGIGSLRELGSRVLHMLPYVNSEPRPTTVKGWTSHRKWLLRVCCGSTLQRKRWTGNCLHLRLHP